MQSVQKSRCMSYETAKLLDGDPQKCQVCGHALRVTDAVLTNVHDGKKGMVHRACTADGVERWNREGRPHATPLGTARRERWTWADAPGKSGSRESVSIARYTVVDDGGFVLGEFDEFLAGWVAQWSAAGRSGQGHRLYDRKGRNGAERR